MRTVGFIDEEIVCKKRKWWQKNGVKGRESKRRRRWKARAAEGIVFILYTFVIGRIFWIESDNLYSLMHEEKKKKEKYIYNNWIYLSVRMKNILWHVKKKKNTHITNTYIYETLSSYSTILRKKILFIFWLIDHDHRVESSSCWISFFDDVVANTETNSSVRWERWRIGSRGRIV